VVVITKRVNVNRQIRASEVRVIDPDGKQVGVMPLEEALKMAEDYRLDLVEVAPNANPPVCRIMDYGKYKYQQSKKSQEARKKQTYIQVKEVKMRPKTDEHDLQFKIRHIKRFLSQKNKAKVTVVFRGREISYTEPGLQVLQRVIDEVGDLGVVEQPPKLEGRNMVMILAPKL